MSEYLKDQTLIGRRAVFKNNLEGYTADLWGKVGVIVQFKGLEHIGISLKFDRPVIRNGLNDMDSCYIAPGSIELIERERP